MSSNIVTTAILILTCFLLFGMFGLVHNDKLREEDLELNKELEILNKPAIKTFETEYGDVFDCVDIYKQPSLDHPLLRDHNKVQINPFSTYSQTKQVSSSVFKINCPIGTVPIRRTTKEDLIKANDFFDQYNAKSRPMQEGEGYYVNPGLYGDKSTRLFSLWSADGTRGCYNTRCTGFTQTGSTPLDQVFQTSKRDVNTTITLSQLKETGDWWLQFGPDQTDVGYWKKSLFNHLSNGAEHMELGGQVFPSTSDYFPQMGTGFYDGTRGCEVMHSGGLVFRHQEKKQSASSYSVKKKMMTPPPPRGPHYADLRHAPHNPDAHRDINNTQYILDDEPPKSNTTLYVCVGILVFIIVFGLLFAIYCSRRSKEKRKITNSATTVAQVNQGGFGGSGSI
ncbi:hypothetical protein IFM89_009816 [Coptis chinensis]|uniref:Neprosin PEP catalytic domain-containing protein n=1 Tax=Coptis chinensis TaxID=261450 RepID=A0A835HWW4_9MAGN|nr:hypothetical protein IFM89_009816 [Coptis chinensis]